MKWPQVISFPCLIPPLSAFLFPTSLFVFMIVSLSDSSCALLIPRRWLNPHMEWSSDFFYLPLFFIGFFFCHILLGKIVMFLIPAINWPHDGEIDCNHPGIVPHPVWLASFLTFITPFCICFHHSRWILPILLLVYCSLLLLPRRSHSSTFLPLILLFLCWI